MGLLSSLVMASWTYIFYFSYLFNVYIIKDTMINSTTPNNKLQCS